MSSQIPLKISSRPCGSICSVHYAPGPSASTMNIMKKFWGSGGSAPEDAVMSQQIALSLTHLRKLYAEFIRPPHPLTEPEREAKLYSMLPLFCKVSWMRFCNQVD